MSTDLRLDDQRLAGRMQTLLDAPAELLLPERILLYALVRALAPVRLLEIGTHFGGSTAVIVSALDDVGVGTLVCVDPRPSVAPSLWESLAHRAHLLVGASPGVLPRAAAIVGGPFDFAFIDGDHRADGVRRDIEAVVPLAAPGACLLCHDAHHPDVAAGIELALETPTIGAALVDCGILSTASTPAAARPSDGRVERWGGLRLLRLRESE